MIIIIIILLLLLLLLYYYYIIIIIIQLFGCTNFPSPPSKSTANVAFRKLGTPTHYSFNAAINIAAYTSFIKSHNAIKYRKEPNRMEPNESMNRSRHEPRQNRTGTKHFAVPKLIFEPVRIDANHGNPDIIWYNQNIFENWVKPSEMRVRTYHDMFFDELWKSGLIMKKCGINRYSWYSHQTWLWYIIHIDMEVCYHQTLGAVWYSNVQCSLKKNLGSKPI
jgi:hypothetical protein